MRIKAVLAGEGASLVPSSASSAASSAAAASAAASAEGEKCIVFSCFPEALQIAEAALARNGVPCLLLASPRSIYPGVRRFSADPALPVLLMPLGAGAEGLNITRASHVFLLEPSFSPALEAQALGRVDRIGQARPTYLHRLLTQGTVEVAVERLSGRRGAARARGERAFVELHAASGGAAAMLQALALGALHGGGGGGGGGEAEEGVEVLEEDCGLTRGDVMAVLGQAL